MEPTPSSSSDGSRDDSAPTADESALDTLRSRLANDFTSDDPTVRAQGWWTLGVQLHFRHHDPVGAAAAYREAIAARGPDWITLAATLNLAQVLEDVDDADGARLAYEQVFLRASDLPDADLSDPAIAQVVAQRLADLMVDEPVAAPDGGTT